MPGDSVDVVDPAETDDAILSADLDGVWKASGFCDVFGAFGGFRALLASSLYNEFNFASCLAFSMAWIWEFALSEILNNCENVWFDKIIWNSFGSISYLFPFSLWLLMWILLLLPPLLLLPILTLPFKFPSCISCPISKFKINLSNKLAVDISNVLSFEFEFDNISFKIKW